MKDKLLIATNVKKTIEYIEKLAVNYPNKENVLKNRLINTMYDMLENVYMANISTEDRKNYIRKVITNIKMVDYYLKISVDKKIISLKKYVIVGNHLLDINKMVIMWLKNEKSR